jgi:hypothetical protein
MTARGRRNVDANAWLSAAALPAAAVLELDCCPMALWNEDRTQGVFNGAMRALLGFYENDFSANQDLWLRRVDASDRERLLSSWRNLRIGDEPMVCRYRFMPLGGGVAIELEETALRFAVEAREKSAILSRYTAAEAPRHGPSPVHGLVHKIGNRLQTVRGEVDLLRLSGGLPQRTFDSITEGIDSIHKFVAEIDSLAGTDAKIHCGNNSGLVEKHTPESGDNEV